MNLATPTFVVLGPGPRVYASPATVVPRGKPEDEGREAFEGEVFATLSAV